LTLVDATPTRRVEGTGPRSVLVPHDKGVTVFAPETAKIVRVGTDHDLSLPAPQLADPVGAAQQAPSELVPAAVGSSATVLIVRGDRLLSIDVGRLGCPHPGSPVVHADRIYVPCLGSGRVLVLNAEGGRAVSDISVAGGGDPKLVVDDGELIINVPGNSTGIVVDASGRTRSVRTHNDDVPPRDPAVQPPTVLPSNTGKPRQTRGPTQDPRPNPGAGSGTGTSTGTGTVQSPTSSPPPASPRPTTPPPSSAPTTTTPPPAPAQRNPPTNVSAQARQDGTIGVSWVPQGQPDQYRVLRGDTLAEVATVPGGATSAIVTTVAPGTSLTVIVEADYGGVRVRSAPSGSVRVFTGPDAPGGVTVVLITEATTVLTVEARWGAAPDNGSAITGYSVTIRSDRGFQQTVQVAGLTSGSVQVSCGSACNGIHVNATVSAKNAAGTGPSSAGAYAYTAPAVPVITSATCEYTGNSHMFCDLEYTGTGSIRWQLQGNAIPSGNDKTFVSMACGGITAPIRVTVTVTNVSGSDTATTGVGRCSGPAQ
jgi:hypothetical protein